jgi:hypothetical protein
MERLTYDFSIGGNHCWQVKGADNLECREVCQRQGDKGCKDCPIAVAFDRLAAIEDILGEEYDLDRLRELVQADRERRTVSDLVRNMSDDELLELIEEIRIHCCPPLCDQNHYCDEDCHKGIAAWLNGPADERILDYLKRPKMKEGASEDTSP